MENLIKTKNAAGGFQFSVSRNKGNTGLGEEKQKAIIDAVQDIWTEGVYQNSREEILRHLLNGNTQYLTKDVEDNIYYFA